MGWLIPFDRIVRPGGNWMGPEDRQRGDRTRQDARFLILLYIVCLGDSFHNGLHLAGLRPGFSLVFYPDFK